MVSVIGCAEARCGDRCLPGGWLPLFPVAASLPADWGDLHQAGPTRHAGGIPPGQTLYPHPPVAGFLVVSSEEIVMLGHTIVVHDISVQGVTDASIVRAPAARTDNRGSFGPCIDQTAGGMKSQAEVTLQRNATHSGDFSV